MDVLKEIFANKKVTLPVSVVIGLVIAVWQVNKYLDKNLFGPIEKIESKLDREVYEKDQWRDSIRQATDRYWHERELKLQNEFSKIKIDSITRGGR